MDLVPGFLKENFLGSLLGLEVDIGLLEWLWELLILGYSSGEISKGSREISVGLARH